MKILSLFRDEIGMKELYRAVDDKVNKVNFINLSHNKKGMFSLLGRHQSKN